MREQKKRINIEFPLVLYFFLLTTCVLIKFHSLSFHLQMEFPVHFPNYTCTMIFFSACKFFNSSTFQHDLIPFACFLSLFFSFTVRPLSVKIMKDLKFMSTKQKYDLKCEVRGSRPAAKISWWLGSTLLTNTSEMVIYLMNIFLFSCVVMQSCGELFFIGSDEARGLTRPAISIRVVSEAQKFGPVPIIFNLRNHVIN